MLWFWVIVLVALIGAIAVVAAGRGDSMAEVYDDRPDANLPTGRPLNAEDLRSLRFNTGVRGYRMDEVDALLSRLEAEMMEREDEGIRLLAPTDEHVALDEVSPDRAPPGSPDQPQVVEDEIPAAPGGARYLEPTRVIEPWTPAGEAPASDAGLDDERDASRP